METNYRIAYNKGWQDLKKRVPEEIESRLSAAYNSGSRQFTVKFFKSEYILDCDSETIRRKSDGQAPDMMASIIILNYLSFSEISIEQEDRWVSLKEIPNGGALFYPAFRKNTIEVLIQAFRHRPEELLRCGAALGGQPASMGSASVVFQAFPEIPLCVILWEGDEEVRANATVLYKPSAAHLLHMESLIGLGMYLGAKLKKLAEVKIESTILREKENLNIHEYAFIKPSQVIFSGEVRSLCENNVCGMYGKSWACPPAVGSIENCKSKCSEYKNAFVFTTLTALKDRYDVNEWLEGRMIHERITDQVTQIFRDAFGKTLTLSAEGCTVCKTCTYPDKPCRFPERMYPAAEGFGILVTQLAEECKIRYNNGPDSLTYFSIIFFSGPVCENNI